MAKQHERDSGHSNGVYELVAGRRVTVDSAVRSLKVPTGPNGTKVDVDPKYLHVGDDIKGDYKFMRAVTIPCLPSGITDENIGAAVEQLMHDLKAYDAATEIVATVKRKDGSEREIRGQRTIKLCAEYDKNGNVVREMTAGEKIAACIMGELVLSLQKVFYKANLPKALAAAYDGTLTGEPYEKPPAKATRTKKVVEGADEDLPL